MSSTYEPARGQPARVEPIPDGGAAIRTLGTRREFFVQVAENRVRPLTAAKCGCEESFCQRWRRQTVARHDSSVPSSPCHRRNSPRLDARSADKPEGVTVK
jgi:hypothetical protein